MDPPELPVAQLVRLTGLFGISENRARVALSRMVPAGRPRRTGRGAIGWRGISARQVAAVGQPAGATAPYDGEWWLAVVTTAGSTAEVRGARRRALAYGRLAELREGVWMRPANLAVRLPGSPGADVEMMTARPGGLPEELAHRPVGPGGMVGPRPATCWAARRAATRRARGAGSGFRALGRGAAAPAGGPPAACRARCPSGWPGGRSAPPMTVGRPLPRRRCGSGAGPALVGTSSSWTSNRFHGRARHGPGHRAGPLRAAPRAAGRHRGRGGRGHVAPGRVGLALSRGRSARAGNGLVASRSPTSTTWRLGRGHQTRQGRGGRGWPQGDRVRPGREHRGGHEVPVHDPDGPHRDVARLSAVNGDDPSRSSARAVIPARRAIRSSSAGHT